MKKCKHNEVSSFLLIDLPREIIAFIYQFIPERDRWTFGMSQKYFIQILKNNWSIFKRINFFQFAFNCSTELPTDYKKFELLLEKINTSHTTYLRIKNIKKIFRKHFNLILNRFPILETLVFDTKIHYSLRKCFRDDIESCRTSDFKLKTIYTHHEFKKKRKGKWRRGSRRRIIEDNKNDAPEPKSSISIKKINAKLNPCYFCSTHCSVELTKPITNVIKIRLREECNQCSFCMNCFCGKCSPSCITEILRHIKSEKEEACHFCIMKEKYVKVSLPEPYKYAGEIYCPPNYVLKCCNCSFETFEGSSPIQFATCCVCYKTLCHECWDPCYNIAKNKYDFHFRCKHHRKDCDGNRVFVKTKKGALKLK